MKITITCRENKLEKLAGVFPIWDGYMARKTEGNYELQIVVHEKEIQKLERGEPLEIGLISLGPCIKVTLKKAVKSVRKVGHPAS